MMISPVFSIGASVSVASLKCEVSGGGPGGVSVAAQAEQLLKS